MRVADDDRARIPFALVAVLLLLGSATYAATMRGRPPGGADPNPDAAIDRTESATRTILVRATDDAARRAAREPVLDAANTTYGRVLDNTTTFRDYLRVRIYLAARRSLSRTHQTVGDVRVDASLPPVSNASDLRRAIERISLTRNGTTLEVEFREVQFVAVRDGRTLLEERRSIAVAVDNPVLALHERTQTFEDRLNSRNMTLRFTALMYSVAWTRGYLQHGGFPIENVVANRHAEVMTNAAVLATQRSVFGRSDPEGRRAFRRALLQVGLRDVMAPALGPGSNGWLGVVLRRRPSPLDTSEPVGGRAPSLQMPDVPAPSPEDNVTVGINGTADVAFARFLQGQGGTSFTTLINTTYDTRAVLTSKVNATHLGTAPPPDRPGPNWTLVNTTATVVRTTHRGAGPLPSIPDGWDSHGTYDRHVVVHHRLTRRWERGDDHTTTNASYEDHYRVGLRVVDDHAFSRHAPDNRIRIVHERGGPLNGPNLLWTPGTVTKRLIADRGGIDAIAKRAVTDARNHSDVNVLGQRPTNMTQWVYRDLVRLRERVRNVTVTVTRGGLATTTNPARRLANELQRNRSAFLDAPDVYRSVADKVRVTARGAYLDRVISHLRRRASRIQRTKETVDEGLSTQELSTERAGELLRNRRFESGSGDERDELRVTVDGGPPYLTLPSVSHDRVPAVAPGRKFHPLVAENINLFTIPYADAARGASGSSPGATGRKGFRSTALTLQTANRLVTPQSNESVRVARDQVRTKIQGAVTGFVDRLADPVARVTGLNSSQRSETIRTGLGRYETPAARAIALANGSAAAAVVDAVDDRTNLSWAARDWLRMRFRLVLADGVTDEGSLPSSATVSTLSHGVGRLSNRATTNFVANRISAVQNRYAGTLSEKLRRRWNDKYDDVLEKTGTENPASIAAGLPVLPSPPGYYFTTNVWVVNVKGEYASFTVRSPRGGPSGRSVAYTRDGDVVRIDVDGDGRRDRLGKASRISFSTRTAVVVVVPPGPPGIGDTNGRMFERSSGWCTPGPVYDDNESTSCR